MSIPASTSLYGSPAAMRQQARLLTSIAEEVSQTARRTRLKVADMTYESPDGRRTRRNVQSSLAAGVEAAASLVHIADSLVVEADALELRQFEERQRQARRAQEAAARARQRNNSPRR